MDTLPNRASDAGPETHPAPEPEYYELLDQAREEILDAMHLLLNPPRVLKGGRYISMSPKRIQARLAIAEAIRMLEAAKEMV